MNFTDMLVINSNGIEVRLVDSGDTDATKRYAAVNGDMISELTTYIKAREMFIGCLDMSAVEVDQFGEPVGLHEMECTTTVTIPSSVYH